MAIADTSSLFPITTVITLNQPFYTKLTQTNFLTWKAQILPIINGHNLSRFITIEPHIPTKTDDVVLLLQSWHNQNQLLLGWIYSSLTEPIQSQLVSCSTMKEL
jgi:hypothetical protein